MRIVDLLDKRSISVNGNPRDKEEAISQLVDLMSRSGKLNDKTAYKNQVIEREKQGTTGVGGGIAIPHGKGNFVKMPALAAMVIKNGVEYDALDGEPVSVIFMIAAPQTADNVHLQVMSKLSVMMMDGEFVDKLRKAKTVEQFIETIRASEPVEETQENADIRDSKEVVENKGVIYAVTSCPTGIAHTYMAAEGLRKAAESRGYTVKVETRGSAGAKNVLTEEEIDEAECIIVAADAKVPMDRFDGKKIIQCPVSEGIYKADELVEKAIKGDAQIYVAKGGESVSVYEKSDRNSTEGTGRKALRSVYTQLMNGVTHMLPFVVGGGILIAIAFLIDSLSVDLSSASEEVKANFGSITEAAALFKKIGDIAFSFMLPILAGYIASAIGDRPALAVGFVGGYMAYAGKSGFLGALIVGFAAGYFILGLKKICDKLPEALEKTAPVLIYPVIGILVIGLLMLYVIEPPVGELNTMLNTALNNMNSSSKILLGIVVAGMMAIDMGGPFNKAAYLFGTASIAEGNYDIMAAVMLGGMVPPCAVALASWIFRKKFTKEERQAGLSSFVMGFAFITEGAIPYAAANPLSVIPSCIVGSALAGALSMAFGCTLMAPHGGIFVFPVVGNPLMYLVALGAGILAGTVMLGLLKRNLDRR